MCYCFQLNYIHISTNGAVVLTLFVHDIYKTLPLNTASRVFTIKHVSSQDEHLTIFAFPTLSAKQTLVPSRKISVDGLLVGNCRH